MSIADERRTEIELTLGRLLALQGNENAALTPHDLEVCICALKAHLSLIDEMVREFAAFEAFLSATPSERYEAYARARGVYVTPEDERSKRPDASIIQTYLGALYQGVASDPFWAELVGGNPARVWRRSPEESPEAFAVRATAALWDFESEEACRRHILRLRKKIRDNPTGWQTAIDPEFLRVPQGRDRDL